MKFKFNKKFIAGIGVALIIILIVLIYLITKAAETPYLVLKYGTPPEHGSSYKN